MEELNLYFDEDEEINLYFDEDGDPELCLSANTCFEISGRTDEGFVVWEENNSEVFKTLEAAINYIKLSVKKIND